MRRETIPQIAENGFDNANKHLHPQSKFKRAWLRLHSAGALLIMITKKKDETRTKQEEQKE